MQTVRQTELLNELLTSGTLPVPFRVVPEPDIDLEWARHCHALQTAAMPGTMPAVELEPLRWAANILLSLARLTVEGTQSLALPTDTGPETRTPGTIVSVDLLFRYLPDLKELLKAANCTDTLLAYLDTLACQWPLSSVGMPLDGELDKGVEATVLQHEDLQLCYLDRIIVRKDHHRLERAAVRQALQSKLGLQDLERLPPRLQQTVSEDRP